MRGKLTRVKAGAESKVEELKDKASDAANKIIGGAKASLRAVESHELVAH